MKTADIRPNPKNPRRIDTEAMDRLKSSIQRDPQFMELRPIVVDADGMILGGNMRYRAIQALGMDEMPDRWVVRAENLTPEQQRRFILVDNAPDGMSGSWVAEILADEWDIPELGDLGFDVEAMGLLEDDDGDPGDANAGRSSLAERFIVPPFSVLNAREGAWQDRKRAWIAIGMRSELGRGGDAAAPGGAMPACDYSQSRARGDGRGRPMQ